MASMSFPIFYKYLVILLYLCVLLIYNLLVATDSFHVYLKD